MVTQGGKEDNWRTKIEMEPGNGTRKKSQRITQQAEKGQQKLTP